MKSLEDFKLMEQVRFNMAQDVWLALEAVNRLTEKHRECCPEWISEMVGKLEDL